VAPPPGPRVSWLGGGSNIYDAFVAIRGGGGGGGWFRGQMWGSLIRIPCRGGRGLNGHILDFTPRCRTRKRVLELFAQSFFTGKIVGKGYLGVGLRRVPRRQDLKVNEKGVAGS